MANSRQNFRKKQPIFGKNAKFWPFLAKISKNWQFFEKQNILGKILAKNSQFSQIFGNFKPKFLKKGFFRKIANFGHFSQFFGKKCKIMAIFSQNFKKWGFFLENSQFWAKFQNFLVFFAEISKKIGKILAKNS